MDNKNITDQLLAMIPRNIRSDSPDLNISDVRHLLTRLDRQEVLLLVAGWLYEHKEDLPFVSFELGVYDERVDLADEVVITGNADDPEALIQSVETLKEQLDESIDNDNETYIDRLIDKLNKAQWNFPESWAALETMAEANSTVYDISGEAWLGEHLAAWERADMEANTQPGNPSATPRARM